MSAMRKLWWFGFTRLVVFSHRLEISDALQGAGGIYRIVDTGEAEGWFASHELQSHAEARQRRVDSEHNVHGREKPLKNSAIATT